MKRFLRAFIGLMALIGLQTAPALHAQAVGQPKVAVYNFKDPNGSGLATELRDMISTAVINSGKFTVFSRDFASAEEEAQLSRAGKTTRGAAKSKVQAESIDYTIEGSITSVQAGVQTDNTGSTVSKTLLGVDLGGCSKQVISISIDVIVKHIGTQQTPYAASLTRSLQTKCSQSGATVDLPAAMRDISNELAQDFATKIYPIKVIAVQADGGVVFNYGSTVLPAGTFLKVFGPGEEILSDGKMVTMDGPYLGRIQITNANPETARGVVEGESAPMVTGSVAQIDGNQVPAKPVKKKKGR